MYNLNDIFNNKSRADAYKRVDDSHPLDLYVGKDELSRWTLLLMCDIKPKKISSSKMISAQIRKRDDGKWTVSLSLVQDGYGDMFMLFCGDIIESSRFIKNKDKGANFVIKRYLEWKEMLAASRNGLLTPAQIKGLLGEMYILDKELIPHYGAEQAALSWTGPRAFHQDFIFNDTWCEVKTISSGKDEVKISSVEQLDCQNNGNLIVVVADKTSMTSANAVNLNSIYRNLLSKITDDDVKEVFCDMLLKYGYYPRSEYEDADYTFEVKYVQRYLVTESFPCFRRKKLNAAIISAEYCISLPAIKEYLIKEEVENGIE